MIILSTVSCYPIRSLGYQVVTANDGVDALGVMNHHSVDIVVTDVNMPNMDGYRLTQHLRQLNVTLPLIGVTANVLAEEKQRCIKAGMDNCLPKPISLKMLEQTLAYYSQQVRQIPFRDLKSKRPGGRRAF